LAGLCSGDGGLFLLCLLLISGLSGNSGTGTCNPNLANKIRVSTSATRYCVRVFRVRAIRVQVRVFRVRVYDFMPIVTARHVGYPHAVLFLVATQLRFFLLLSWSSFFLFFEKPLFLTLNDMYMCSSNYKFVRSLDDTYMEQQLQDVTYDVR
jgi:hypothetical protein